ncbi:lmo0937 family membrane protein [Clostridium guangxiense]|nr:lmo0937 family membrane protein [Clostridium guangxiense]MCD2347954.1 lmo0937 family membrane protein [Clostridium guangxiense]
MKLLRTIGGIIVFFGVLGLVFRIGGFLIHWLLVAAVAVFIYDFITGKKR